MNHTDLEILNDKIESEAEIILAKILNQNFVRGGDDLYHIDNFIADMQIPTYDFVYFIKGNGEHLQESLDDQLEKWCEEIAVKLIKQGE